MTSSATHNVVIDENVTATVTLTGGTGFNAAGSAFYNSSVVVNLHIAAR